MAAWWDLTLLPKADPEDPREGTRFNGQHQPSLFSLDPELLPSFFKRYTRSLGKNQDPVVGFWVGGQLQAQQVPVLSPSPWPPDSS